MAITTQGWVGLDISQNVKKNYIFHYLIFLGFIHLSLFPFHYNYYLLSFLSLLLFQLLVYFTSIFKLFLYESTGLTFFPILLPLLWNGWGYKQASVSYLVDMGLNHDRSSCYELSSEETIFHTWNMYSCNQFSLRLPSSVMFYKISVVMGSWGVFCGLVWLLYWNYEFGEIM